MADIIEYKCPCCGGAITFDSSIQKMKCPYCDSEFELETLKNLDEALSKEQKEDSLDWEMNESEELSDDAGLKSYICRSCGGEIVTDATTGATHCPFCSNPVVMTEKFAGLLKPDLVIPFKFDKKAAKAAFEKHLTGKKLLPKVFKDQAHIDEIKGVYVPFWLFSADADAQIQFKGTRVKTWRSGDYRYTKTDYYKLLREGSLSFDGVPVDGSQKMADDLMESLEPFDLSNAVDFQTAYLSGYFADKYDVSAEESIKRANERIKATAEDTFKRETCGSYMTVTTEESSVQLREDTKTIKYALYPVWVMNTTWNGEKYTFAMNGQSGKFVGNLPMDKGIYWKYRGLFTALFGAAATLIAWLLLK